MDEGCGMDLMFHRLLTRLGVLLAAGVWVCSAPNLDQHRDLLLPPVSANAKPDTLTVQFMGITTLLFSDGQTNVLTDGFFTRPGLARVVLLDVEPDRAEIARSLAKARVDRLDAVLVLHSHYDHAMDAPIVAQTTGALLLGSESTANIGRGLSLPEDRIKVVKHREAIRMGRFLITFIENRHYPWKGWLGDKLRGSIDRPLIPPASAFDYKEGKTYSLLIEHGRRRILLHGSAGFVPGALRDVRADTVLLGTGGTGGFSEAEFSAYLSETVDMVRPGLVIPIHWDNMFKSAIPQPVPEKDLASALKRLKASSGSPHRYEVRLLPAWQKVEL